MSGGLGVQPPKDTSRPGSSPHGPSQPQQSAAGVIFGMTGTRKGITPFQRLWLHAQIADAAELHHGACVGADAAAHKVALQHEVHVVVHPPEDAKLAMTAGQLLSLRGGVSILSPKPYLTRNREIVRACERLIALPDGPERDTGGTWYTVRYAVNAGKPVEICYPDGTVEQR